MGRSVITLSQHTLNIEDSKILIQQLAERFDANVFYCFIAAPDWGVDAFEERLEARGVKNPDESPAYIIDEYIIGDDKPSLVLIDENYYYQWLYNKYGEQAGLREEFIKSWTDDPEMNNEIIHSFIKDDSSLNLYVNDELIFLYRECAEIGYMGRTYFLELILRETDLLRGSWQKAEDYISFLEHRDELKDIILKLGGSCAYYVCENGKYDAGLGQGPEWGMSWKEIEKKFNQGEPLEYQLNLIDLLSNEAYLEQVHKKYMEENIDYSVFYDDFRELTPDQLIPIDD